MQENASKIEKSLREIFIDVLSQRKFDLLDHLIAPDAVFYDGKDKISGKEGIKKLVMQRNAAIPDFHYTIDKILIDNDYAVVRWHATGKTLQDFAGFKAGESANYWGISMLQFKDGLIIRDWANSSIVDEIPEN